MRGTEGSLDSLPLCLSWFPVCQAWREPSSQPLNCNGHNMLVAALPRGCCQKLAQHNGKSQGFGIGQADARFSWAYEHWVILSPLWPQFYHLCPSDSRGYGFRTVWVRGGICVLRRASGLGKKQVMRKQEKAKTESTVTRGCATGLHVPPDGPLSPLRDLSHPPVIPP